MKKVKEKEKIALAFKWEYKFNRNMTEEDLRKFRKDCKKIGVTPLDIYPYMEDEYNI